MPVYQEKDKNKWTKDGRKWYFKCQYTDMYGNRKQKKSKLFLTKEETKIAESEFLTHIIKSDETDHNVTFEKVYREWWEYKKQTLKITTQYSGKKRRDTHILEYFKKYRLHDIKISALNDWKNQLLDKNFSSEYKNRIIGDLKEILNFAIDNYDFDRKVASKLQKQHFSKNNVKMNDAEINYWTLDEFNTFIKKVQDPFDELTYNFLYYTGLRLGEMIALTWKDIDLENKKLKINKTFTNKIETEIYAILDPKTTNSFRVIDLDDDLVKKLKKHYQNEKSIYNFNEDMFVFGNAIYTSPTTFARHLNYWIQQSGVKKITPHGFRHSHASLLIDLGCTSRQVADRLGDTVSVVESTYIHLFPKKREETIDKLNNLFQKNNIKS